MAYGYASYVEKVAAAGRDRCNVPLFANAWLESASAQVFDEELRQFVTDPEVSDQGMQGTADIALTGGSEPGTYPSGGPLPRVAPIWKATAPSLDFLSPDIYFGFDVAARQYKGTNLPLFIPEMRRSQDGVAEMFVAIGQYRALGISPFGVDSLTRDPVDAFERNILKDDFRLLNAAAEQLRLTPDAETAGFHLTAQQPAVELSIGAHTLKADTADPFGVTSRTYPAYGLIIATGTNELLVIGRGFSLSFPNRENLKTGLLGADELEFDQQWQIIRRLGGDETGSGSNIKFPVFGAEQSTVFPIASTIEQSGIVRISLYKY